MSNPGAAAAAGAAAPIPAAVSALLAKHSSLSVTSRGRVQCSLTGHECMPTVEAVASYVGGRKFLKARKWYARPLDAVLPVALRPLAAAHLRPHKDSDKLLYCTLTKRAVNRIPEEVVAHLLSRRFESAVANGGVRGGAGGGSAGEEEGEEEGGEGMDEDDVEGDEDEGAGGDEDMEAPAAAAPAAAAPARAPAAAAPARAPAAAAPARAPAAAAPARAPAAAAPAWQDAYFAEGVAVGGDELDEWNAVADGGAQAAAEARKVKGAGGKQKKHKQRGAAPGGPQSGAAVQKVKAQKRARE